MLSWSSPMELPPPAANFSSLNVYFLGSISIWSLASLALPPVLNCEHYCSLLLVLQMAVLLLPTYPASLFSLLDPSSKIWLFTFKLLLRYCCSLCAWPAPLFGLGLIFIMSVLIFRFVSLFMEVMEGWDFTRDYRDSWSLTSEAELLLPCFVSLLIGLSTCF